MAHDYRLISADGHLMDPPDLWTANAPAKYRDQVPRMERFDKGDAWVFPDRDTPSPFNWGACAGRAPDQQGIWCRLEDIHPGCYDAKARVEALDLDGIDAELLFPNGLDWVVDAPDRDFQLAMTRIYNDHLAEVCAHAPDRFGGAALVPPISVEDAVAEVQRMAAMPGIVAFLLKRYPNDEATIVPEHDPLWAAIAETGKPLTIHVSLRSAASFNQAPMALPGTVHFYDAPARMLEFIFSGVLDRFPTLDVFLAEIDCGWLPYYAQQCDDNYRRHAKSELRDVKLAAHAERVHEGAVPRVVHHRPVRGREPSRGRRRADALVERLPAHHVRLAVFVEDDRSHVHGRARPRAPRDPRGQRPTAVRLRHLSVPTPWTGS